MAPNIVRFDEHCSSTRIVFVSSDDSADASADAPTPPAAPDAEPGRDRRRRDGGARRGRRRRPEHARGRRPPRHRARRRCTRTSPARTSCSRRWSTGSRPTCRRSAVGNGPWQEQLKDAIRAHPQRLGRPSRPRPRLARNSPDRPERAASGSTGCSASCATPACPDQVIAYAVDILPLYGTATAYEESLYTAKELPDHGAQYIAELRVVLPLAAGRPLPAHRRAGGAADERGRARRALRVRAGRAGAGDRDDEGLTPTARGVN